MSLRVLVRVAIALLWVLAGAGHHALTSACYESRHSLDQEPQVFSGLEGVAVDLAFWPLFTLGNLADPPDCHPKPLQR